MCFQRRCLVECKLRDPGIFKPKIWMFAKKSMGTRAGGGSEKQFWYGSVYVMVVSLNDGQHVVFKAKKTETLTKISESTGPDSSLAKA